MSLDDDVGNLFVASQRLSLKLNTREPRLKAAESLQRFTLG
jgi:hypothetical protein